MIGLFDPREGGKQCALLLLAAMGAGLAVAVGAASEDHIVLLPKLQNGESLQYETRARIDRHVTTKSNVSSMVGPRQVRRDLASALRLDVQEIRLVDHRPLLSAESKIVPLDAPAADEPAVKEVTVMFTVGGDGSIHVAEGAEDLDAEQNLTWQFWVAQFAFGWTLPAAGVKPGEKWKSVEPEKTPSPIASLVWERVTMYVQNDKCPVIPDEQCAVFLTNSTLRQKSNPKDTTPEDYLLHELKTSGTASGSNEMVSYISLRTGLVMRATEDLQQALDVTIAKTDGTNQIHYTITATSYLETALRAPVSPGTE
jgi:hypothetical protein